MSTDTLRPRVTAVLGPTNTGKTYLAIDRMLGHGSGMIGFPLRLLARENYDRIVRIKGAKAVALITGEERIVPREAKYYVCTVESMPVDLRVAFLAVDEVQLAADPDRGHVFTHRILHARGQLETMFLGSETIRPLLRQLVPGAEFITRPRFSQLSYTGPRKLTRLPRRSAVVAFSAADVYSIAEMIRRTRGGTAVVLGALSPRTRNAQVAMFQAGEVEHLVATDAIGMGLNMHVDHVAFAALRKFDGRAPRHLDPSEVAQIAGRAGRHMNDGTFGTTSDVGAMDPELIERVEGHAFAPLRGLYWRNPDLRFSSIAALLASLAAPSQTPGLVRTRPADDQLVLEALAREEDIRRLAASSERVRLLWEVCQVPDFRKVMPETHARLLGQVYRYLTAPGRRLPTDWVAAHLAALDRVDGDIHALSDRIASIRVWTYMSHRGDWVQDSLHWQERARAVEDRLSDALHERLTQRFVDLRTSVLAKRLRQGGPLIAAVAGNDAVTVEGHHLGHLEGLTFVPDKADGPPGAAGSSRTADRAVANAAARALRGEIARRVQAIAEAGDDAFALSDQGRVRWQGADIARLAPGPDVLRPVVEVPLDDLLDPDQRDAVRQRAAAFVRDHVARTLRPLADGPGEALSGAAKGILYQVGEALGALPVVAARAQIAALGPADRKALARLGLRFGTESVFLPALLKAPALRLRAVLWAARRGVTAPAVPVGRMSVAPQPDVPAEFYGAIGYRLVGAVAVRVDVLERFAAEVRAVLRGPREGGDGPAVLPPALLSGIGVSVADGPGVLESLGFATGRTEAGAVTVAQRRRPQRAGAGIVRSAARAVAARADSPFAVLEALAVKAAPAEPPPPARRKRRKRA
ncbi:helicase-related protein [Novispirillum sp. DQ9]|uniref:helicase-related protein n=1 Tax=Novispirillum sp. DQ9 TaxID=3398612 RepID=UPI003C7ED70D